MLGLSLWTLLLYNRPTLLDPSEAPVSELNTICGTDLRKELFETSDDLLSSPEPVAFPTDFLSDFRRPEFPVRSIFPDLTLSALYWTLDVLDIFISLDALSRPTIASACDSDLVIVCWNPLYLMETWPLTVSASM